VWYSAAGQFGLAWPSTLRNCDRPTAAADTCVNLGYADRVQCLWAKQKPDELKAVFRTSLPEQLKRSGK